MTFQELRPETRRLMVVIWVAGGIALLGTVVLGYFTSTPYTASWAWLSFMAMIVLEDVVTAKDEPDWRPRLPRLTLVAATIAFRKHPDLTVLVALAAGPAAGLIQRRPWFTELLRTAAWILAAALGSAILHLVGYQDTPHFVAATIALLILFMALDRIGDGLLQRAEEGTALRQAFLGLEPLYTLVLGIAGSLLALAWRTPAVGPAALRLGEISILIVIGLLIGFFLGKTPQESLPSRISVRSWPLMLVGGGLLMAISTQVPNQASWLTAALGLIAIGAWVVRQAFYGAGCMALGGLCNEIARGGNGGRMPVVISSLPKSLQADFVNLTRDSSTYMLADAHTRLIWLADRFPAAIFPGIASAGDILVAVGIIWLCATGLSRTEPAAAAVELPKAA
jgi:hypothetical protein